MPSIRYPSTRLPRSEVIALLQKVAAKQTVSANVAPRPSSDFATTKVAWDWLVSAQAHNQHDIGRIPNTGGSAAMAGFRSALARYMQLAESEARNDAIEEFAEEAHGTGSGSDSDIAQTFGRQPGLARKKKANWDVRAWLKKERTGLAILEALKVNLGPVKKALGIADLEDKVHSCKMLEEDPEDYVTQGKIEDLTEGFEKIMARMRTEYQELHDQQEALLKDMGEKKTELEQQVASLTTLKANLEQEMKIIRDDMVAMQGEVDTLVDLDQRITPIREDIVGLLNRTTALEARPIQAAVVTPATRTLAPVGRGFSGRSRDQGAIDL